MNLKNLFQPRIPRISGVNLDDRILEEKQKDYLTEEIIKQPVMALNWLTWEEWKIQPSNIKMLSDIKVNHQHQVGSCFAQTLSLILAINNYIEEGRFIEMSARGIYGRRRNQTTRGMYADDGAKIMTTYATPPEVLLPSSNDTEVNMTSLSDILPSIEEIGKIYRANNYFYLQPDSIDVFSQILALGIPIATTIVYGDGEVGTGIEAKLIPNNLLKYGHGITDLEYAYFIYNGKKANLCQNSWGNIGYGGRQIFTEDWFKQGRVLTGIWFTDIDNLAVFNFDTAKPTFNFTKDLYYGMNNSDVAMLQRCLGYEKDADGYMFPLYQSPTGFYGGLTLKAVKRFQTKYGIEPVLGYCGPLTRAKLNELFA